MRILLVGINYAPDLVGVAKYNTELCESLVAEGHDVRVITAPPYYPAWRIPRGFRSWYFRSRKLNGVQVIRTPIYVPARPSGAKRLVHHASFALASAIPLVRTALSWRPDIMLSVAPSLTSAALVAAAARLTGAKSWLHVQDFEVDAAFDLGLLQNQRLRRLMLRAEARILKSFDRVSTISPQMLRRLKEKGIPQEKVREVRNWIDTGAITPGPATVNFRTELEIGEDDVVALYSGTMSNKQGLDLVVEAASVLEQSHPNVHFILAGEGPHKPRLLEMSQGRGNIHFLGVQPNDRFAALMASADIHLIPQRAEAADLVLPSKLGAIFSSGRPVVAMAGSGTGLADEVEGAGLVVPPGDANALAEAVRTLGEDEPLRNVLGKQGRTRALERWNRESIIYQWLREMLSIDDDGARPHSSGGTQLQPEALLLPVKEQVRLTGK
ncbi:MULTISPECIES: WcaI family glycosyltransferase [unclassified Bradyrhizobium]